jgi:putative Holliday junction resolvase
MPDTPDDQTLLALDYGLKNIGVAVGSRRSGSAQPLTTLRTDRNGFPWPVLDRLVAQWDPDLLIVGVVPGAKGPFAASLKRFLIQLGVRYPLPVCPWDERETSEVAQLEMREHRADGRQPRRKSSQFQDAVAACLLIESYLNHPAPPCP